MLAVGFSDGSILMITTHCPDEHDHTKKSVEMAGDDENDLESGLRGP